MKTIVTHVTLKDESGAEWDATMHDRMTAARDQPGWVGGQILTPLDTANKRVIVGTWRSRGDWEAWHDDPDFMATRTQLEGLEAAPSQHWWHEVVEDARSGEELDSAA